MRQYLRRKERGGGYPLLPLLPLPLALIRDRVDKWKVQPGPYSLYFLPLGFVYYHQSGYLVLITSFTIAFREASG